ncbi:putative Transcription factor domain-containing protein [Seiridium cardinale]
MSHEKPRPRPSAAIVSSLQQEKQSLESFLLRLKSAKPAQASAILEGLYFADGSLQLPDRFSVEASGSRENSSSRSLTRSSNAVDDGDADTASDVGFDPSNHVSVDDHGQLGVFGLTSTLHDHVQGIDSNASSNAASEKNNYQLIANAALERQKEFRIRLLPDIDGVPLNIATHLLDLHWNRQHHTFLLTYRPALMRDLLHGGPYCSKLLLNAIFACASKYSDRIYLRDNPSDPLSAGRRFFLRCDELIASEPPFGRPSIPTVVAFLLLGSTFIARGDISKGWAYTGFAARMVYDLGLHLDCKPKTSSEDIEIRRRVFWGAFICDKLQSLYLGRPMAMHLHDNQCPADFADTFEELDLWTPYVDPEVPSSAVVCQPTPVYSVSTFQQLCYLSKLMTRIINCFYSSHTIISKAATNLETLDAALSYWYTHLPTHLAFDDRVKNKAVPSPNVLNLHNTYHSLVILLNRPFVSDGHLRSQSTDTVRSCWKKCMVAARNITSIVSAYRGTYTLRGAPYLTSYAAYVSCTIHVRNAALEKDHPDGEHSRLLMLSLKALDALSTPNPGVTKPAGMIRRLMRKHQIIEPRVIQSPDPSHVDFSYIPELSPQSMTLTSLFDTFVPNQEFGELVGSNGVSSIDNEQWMNDSLFGFMNAVDGFQAAEGTGWTGAGGVLPG